MNSLQFHTNHKPISNATCVVAICPSTPKVLKPRWPRWSQAMVSQTKLSCMVFPLKNPNTRTTCVEISGAMAKFPAKLGAQVGVGQIYYKEGLLRKKTTSFKKSWNEYILPRLVRCHLSAWIWCWWAWQDSLGCMKFTDCAPKLSLWGFRLKCVHFQWI